MKFTLITACKNAGSLIEGTVRSVLDQTAVRDGSLDLEYLILDGCSTDKTLESIAAVDREGLAKVISEPDNGVYDALAKGFRMAEGEIVGYLNAGDTLFPTALEALRDAFADTGVGWITGYNSIANARQQPTRITLPFRYRRQFFENGFHGTKVSTLQQESTFWRKDLMDGLDWEKFRRFRLAGDFMLWQHFSKSQPAHIMHSVVGSFCYHPGQLSEVNSRYVEELLSLCRKPSFIERLLVRFDSLIWKAPAGIKRRLANHTHIVFDPVKEKFVIR